MTLVRKLIPKLIADFGIEGQTIHLFVPDSRLAFPIGDKTVVAELIAKGRSIELRPDGVRAALDRPSEPAKSPTAVALPPLPPPLDDVSGFRKLNSGKSVGGMRNLGNSCYLSATLQCLFSLRGFLEALSPCQGLLTRHFMTLAHYAGNRSQVDLTDFRTLIRAVLPQFSGDGCQDAQEFLSAFIEALRGENPAVIESQFYGSLDSETTCDLCGYVAKGLAPFQVLSLPLSLSRWVQFSPWQREQPIQWKPSLSEVVNPFIVAGLTETFVPFVATTVYSDVVAFGLPPDDDGAGAFAVLWIKVDGDSIPVLMRVDTSTFDVDSDVRRRLADFILPALLRDVFRRMQFTKRPQQWTPWEGSRLCQEDVVVIVQQGRKVMLERKSPPRPPVGLGQLCEGFFLRGQLDVHNKWRCKGCGEDSCAFHQAKIVSGPQNLVVQIKRFTKDGEKDNTAIEVGERIDLGRFTEGGDALYDVRGVVHHSGSRA
jgi:hypothetical protein